MPAWRLSDSATPHVSTAQFHADRSRATHLEDPHHRPRLDLAAEFIRQAAAGGAATLSDLGCGDGGLLALIQHDVTAWGYDFECHAWAFDMDGYRDLIEQGGYRVLRHEKATIFIAAGQDSTTPDPRPDTRRPGADIRAPQVVTMPTRPCLGSALHQPGHTLTNRPGSRCQACTNQVEATRTRGKRARRPYTNTERLRRAEAVKAHREQHGDWCPGWRTPPHPARDLTADHPIEVASGGTETQQLEILCRSCNGRKGATTRRA